MVQNSQIFEYWDLSLHLKGKHLVSSQVSSVLRESSTVSCILSEDYLSWQERFDSCHETFVFNYVFHLNNEIAKQFFAYYRSDAYLFLCLRNSSLFQLHVSCQTFVSCPYKKYFLSMILMLQRTQEHSIKNVLVFSVCNDTNFHFKETALLPESVTFLWKSDSPASTLHDRRKSEILKNFRFFKIMLMHRGFCVFETGKFHKMLSLHK